jgi:hypothetical protein
MLSGCGDSIKWPWSKQQSADEEAAQIHREKLIKEAQNGKVSEVGQAALTAIQKQEEQKMVQRAGEAAVIIELARKQYAELKERLVPSKPVSRGIFKKPSKRQMKQSRQARRRLPSCTLKKLIPGKTLSSLWRRGNLQP